jgi:16S rRNA (cytosine967-C5)-methyltransferase
MTAVSARTVAATVVARVLAGGAFAAAALDAELDRAVQLDARDRALATELVYGTLRLLPWLEARIGRHAKRGTKKLDAVVRAHLAVAAYQILALTRVPAFAAVSEAVGAIRAVRGAQVGGFANAVLRKLASEPRPSEAEVARAAFESAEPTLRAAIVRSVGEEAALAILGYDTRLRAPPLGLRVEDETTRDAWISRLAEARPNATFEAGRVSPHAILAQAAGRIIELPGYDEGAWTPQEEGSQVVALALGAKRGDVVLDACAGRGNKSGLLARCVGTEGAVDVADLHPKKLEQLERELARLGLRPRAAFAVDWTVGTGGASGSYDRILVDAPCSGTGTLRRRPELGLRRTSADLPALAKTQRAIVERASTLLRPGGRLVYAVCSVLEEESEAVLVDASSFGLTPAPFDAPLAMTLAGSGGTTLRLLPHAHGTDGYFVASFVRA